MDDEGEERRDQSVDIVSRQVWGARESKEINYMGTPVSVVFVHHTNMNTCLTHDTCCDEMKVIQNFHMDDRGWDDIGYNFLIGENGRVYEGRAWDRIGAHTLGWNDVAIAFSFMGDFSQKLPTTEALSALRDIIQYGIRLGKITSDYKLYGHRDVRDTECPGDVLYEHIKTWEHFGFTAPVKPNPIPFRECKLDI